jgi:hypothetical protein
MNWNDIKERLKSPVVVVQLIVDVIAPAVILFWPEITTQAQIIVGVVAGAYNVFAGLNNPTDRQNF